jgi:hypothetical protein
MVETLGDVERTFAVLDGKEPTPGALVSRIAESRRGGFNPHQSYVETPYFRVRCFKNGHAHLWFTRDDLVDKANGVLADYYGEVLPDAVPKGETLRSTTTALSRDLAFYPSPKAVVRALLDDLPHVGVFLEPSAGDGAIVQGLLDRNDVDRRRGDYPVQIRAIEVDAGRAKQISTDCRVQVTVGNFLGIPASPAYDAVVMNPPFEGTHWMQHILHAFDFLRPGGVLRAVLPATAEVGTSSKHEEFRAWAVAMNDGREWGLFRDLPPESFAASGTRVQTVIFTLTKPRR